MEDADHIDYCYHRHPSSQMLIASFEDSMMTLFEPLLISFNLLTSHALIESRLKNLRKNDRMKREKRGYNISPVSQVTRQPTCIS